MADQSIAKVKALLHDWGRDANKDLGPESIYCFGSLIYQDGAQFSEVSDVDLLVIIPEIPDAIERADWLERLLDYKIRLEDNLGKLLRRPDRSALICSVVAITQLELAADIHKGGSPAFFSKNNFWNVETGAMEVGLAGAGAQPIAERLVGECVKFTQNCRNQYLGVNALGDELLMPFADETDAAPKQCMRHAAMVRFLEDDGDGDPGAEYDVHIGANRLTVLLDERRGQLRELVARYGSRRGGRTARAPLSSKDQLVLAELVFDAAVQVEAKPAATNAAPKKPSTHGAHSTVTFAERFASAFPGVRGVEWFDDDKTIRMRLACLLTEPLEFEDSTPFWWSRGGSNLHISHYEERNDFVMINRDEMKVRRIAAVNRGSYKYNFVYVEVAPLPPTGIYEHTPERIAETERGDSPFPYYWEEYAIVDGQHLVTRAVYDDGSALIGDKLQSIAGRAELRSRFVTPYNFIIAAGGASIFDSRYDQQLEEHLNAMLRGEDRLETIAKDGNRLQTGRF
ncbi:hypothetical protein [Novosphingobium sp.]|uniref:hypothetical protein n=1 Tax=Novosphingobium sp. TaxID=1874826 RepID=UPI003D096EFC